MSGTARCTFDVELFKTLWQGRGLSLGQPIVAVAETSSTNDDAMEAARSGAQHGAVFVADLQTRGRGRRGHRWTSPPGENLTFSLVLRPEVSWERVTSLTLVLGLAVREAAARRVSVPVGVKWPNDVVAADRKLAGILVETQLLGDRVMAVVAGVGLNVAMREVPQEIAAVATSLALLGDPTPSREAVLVDVLEGLERRLPRFVEDGLEETLPELRAHDVLRGSRVRVDGLEGVADGIDDAGALLVRDATGWVQAVNAGTVERL